MSLQRYVYAHAFYVHKQPDSCKTTHTPDMVPHHRAAGELGKSCGLGLALSRATIPRHKIKYKILGYTRTEANKFLLPFTTSVQVQYTNLDIGNSDRRSMRREHTKTAHPSFAAHVWKREWQRSKREITGQRHADKWEC